jgi:cytochrome c oxidase subunit 3
MSTTTVEHDGHHQTGYELNAVHHPYHLVAPSPWPLFGALSAGVLAVGLVLYMHGEGMLAMFAGIFLILTTMALWWRDVIKEAVWQKLHTPVVKIGLRYGMMLFIASEVMFFAAFFWAFFDASLFTDESIQYARVEYTGGLWPPKGIEAIDAFKFPLTMTLILLLSGCTVTFAHHNILAGDNRKAARMLGLTVLLGVIFTSIQAYEYSHAEFAFDQGIYPSTFYMATGFHGFHVMIGTIFLAVCWWRTTAGHFTPQSHFGLEAAAWYWHFVDVVWLFLFVAVYVWGGSGLAGHAP